jgi:hypothetical protein
MDLRQSTTITINMGAFVDKTDGVTPETGVSPTVKLSKNGGTLAARNSATAITHDADGHYKVELNATDTNTLGRLRATVTDAATHLAVWEDFMVLTPAEWDTRYAGLAAIQSATSSTVVLDTGASAVDDYYNGDLVVIMTGTGAGQSRYIQDYTGSTKTAAITPNWATTPTTGATFILSPGTAFQSNIRKNQALTAFVFLMTDSTTHAPVTGKSVTVTRSIDGGAFAAGTLSAVTELSNGLYKVNFGAADLNGNVIVLRATAATSDDTFERIITAP